MLPGVLISTLDLCHSGSFLVSPGDITAHHVLSCLSHWQLWCYFFLWENVLHPTGILILSQPFLGAIIQSTGQEQRGTISELWALVPLVHHELPMPRVHGRWKLGVSSHGSGSSSTLFKLFINLTPVPSFFQAWLHFQYCGLRPGTRCGYLAFRHSVFPALLPSSSRGMWVTNAARHMTGPYWVYLPTSFPQRE